jgi:hypothetical protein
MDNNSSVKVILKHQNRSYEKSILAVWGCYNKRFQFSKMVLGMLIYYTKSAFTIVITTQYNTMFNTLQSYMTPISSLFHCLFVLYDVPSSFVR